MTLQNIAYYTGAAYLIYQLTQVIKFLYAGFIRPAKDLKKLGEWSIVTGPTSGIGKGLAMELARQKQNLVLIGRNLEKLKAVAEEVEALKVQVKIVQVDFSKFDEAAKKRVTDTCDSLDIGVLVNNAGLSYVYPQYFQDLDVERAENICKVNCEALVTMTRLIVPNMLKKNKGTVINLSSAQAVAPSQLMIVYGASKAFVNNFTYNMNLEFAGKNVTFAAHAPMYVISAMSGLKERHKSITVPTAEQYARAAVKQFGYAGILSPYWSHAFYLYLIECLPEFIIAPLVMSSHRQIRKKAMKKYNKSK